MYKKRQSVNKGSYDVKSNPFCSDVRIHRPLSFYVRGGVDIKGQDMRPPLPSVSDDVDAPGEVNLLTDANYNMLDLAELASVAATESERRALEKATGEHLEESE